MRISPADAQIGLSKREGDPRGKVAGDELAHFSAFLRRDWRSNDILYGRLDGICQIIRSLVDEKALERILNRQLKLGEVLAGRGSPVSPMFLTETRRESLLASWEKLRKAWDERDPGMGWNEAVRGAAQSFREKLILAGQEDAFQEEIQSIYRDMHYQEVKFGKKLGPRGALGETADALIESEAETQALEDLKDLSLDEKWERFSKMGMGSQSAVGPNGQLPGSVVGEYATLVYLAAWGLLRKTLKERAAGILERWSVRLIFRIPALFAHFVFVNMRRERPFALGGSYLAVGVLSGMATAAFICGGWRLFAFSVLTLLGSLFILVQVLKGRPRS